MKKKLLLVALIFYVIGFASGQCVVDAGENQTIMCSGSVQLNASSPTWSAITTPELFSEIEVVTENTVWALNDNSIYVTYNNGNNWMHKLTTGYSLQGISVTSQGKGIAVGYYYSSGFYGVVYEMQNGNDWQNVLNLVSGKKYWGAQVFDDNTAYIIGNHGFNGIFAKKTLGENSITELSSFSANNYTTSALSFSDKNNGFVCGQWADGKIWKTNNAGTTWTEITQTVDNEPFSQLYDIQMVNANIVIATGFNQSIYKSSDGGASWQRIQKTDVAEGFVSISFYDDTHGYIAGQMGTLLYTEDGGNTWQQINPETDNLLFEIQFLAENIGYLVSSNNQLLRKADNSFSWSPQTGLNNPNIANPIATPNQTTTYTVTMTNNLGCEVSDQITIDVFDFSVKAFGTQVYCGQSLQLEAQTNYTGNNTINYSWNNNYLLTASNVSNPSTNPNIWMSSDVTFTVTANISETNCTAQDQVDIYRKMLQVEVSEPEPLNYGENVILNPQYDKWIRKISYLAETINMNLTDLSFIDQNIGFAGSDKGHLMKTNDGSNFWKPLHSPVNFGNKINSIHFSDEQNGIVSYRDGAFKTTDGGNTWTQILWGKASEYYGKMYFITQDIGFITTLSGKIYKTTNNGVNWNSTLIQSNSTINSISFLNDQQTGFLIAQDYNSDNNFYLYKTTNQGNTWTYIKTIPYQEVNNINTIFFINQDQGFIAGGIPKYTTNGGLTWQSVDLDINMQDDYSLDVQFADQQNGFYISSKKIFATYDGGNTWNQEYLFTEAVSGENVFSGLEVINQNLAYVSAYNGQLFKKINLQFSWDPQDYLSNPLIENPVCTPPISFNTQLTIRDQDGCFGSDWVYIQLNNPCIASVEIDNLGNGQYAFSPTYLDSYEGYDFFWQFGDGGFSYESAPTYQFSNCGYYDFSLTMRKDNCFVQSDYILNYGDVNDCYAYFNPVVNDETYTLSPQNIPNNNIDNYYWYFDDGNYSSEMAPVHTYTERGLYDVCLAVTGYNGCADIFCQKVNVGGDSNSCIADFIWLANPENNTVYFKGADNQEISTHYWNFGDNSTSVSPAPQHTYTQSGYYLVNYTIQDFSNTCSDQKYKLVNVGAGNNGFHIDFGSIIKSQGEKETQFMVKFQNATFGSATKYTWDFGDGSDTESTSLAPTHIYQTEGTYNVCLKVEDYRSGFIETYCKTIILETSNIQQTIDLNFNIFPNPVTKNININYTIPKESSVSIELLSINGQSRKMFFGDKIEAGSHTYNFNLEEELPEGIYLIKIKTDNQSIAKKIFIKK